MDNSLVATEENCSSHKDSELKTTDQNKREKDEQAVSNLRERIPDIDNIFNLHGRIGVGTFSTVLLASLKTEEDIPYEKRNLFAIKHLIPTIHPNRVLKELKCLIDIGGRENVIGVDLCLRRNESVALVMPYLPHDFFPEYYNKMNVAEVQNYMKNLLIAIKRVHKFNIIHRDIKPSNFLYNRKMGKFVLVDFGLAQSVRLPSSTSLLHTGRSSNKPGISTESITERKRRLIEDSSNDIQIHNDTKRIKIAESCDSLLQRQSNDGVFKMPLKQINEITLPKTSETDLKEKTTPLVRQMKPAILGMPAAKRQSDKIINNLPSTSNQSLCEPGPSTSIGNKVTNLDTTDANSTEQDSSLKSNLSSISPQAKCHCYGRPQVCNICLVKREIPASRAGTPGYRPPEVLLKYTDQTTAVDIWAVGVIFITILSGVYPFFKAPDDFIALAEIVTIFGDEVIRRTAFVLGRQITMSRKCKPLDLKRLCVRLRNRGKFDRNRLIDRYEMGEECPECGNCQQLSFDCLCLNSTYKTEPSGEDIFPIEAYDLLKKLLEINPHKRITAEKALEHPFFTKVF